MNKATRKPIHAGELLEEYLTEMGISQNRFAQHIGVSVMSINLIIRGKGRLVPKMAVKIAAALGTSPEFWLNAQRVVDLWNLRGLKLPKRIKAGKKE